MYGVEGQSPGLTDQMSQQGLFHYLHHFLLLPSGWVGGNVTSHIGIGQEPLYPVTAGSGLELAAPS